MTERSLEKVKVWIREHLSEKDSIDRISVSKHFTFAINNFSPAINSGLDLTPYFCTRPRASERAKGFASCSCFTTIYVILRILPCTNSHNISKGLHKYF